MYGFTNRAIADVPKWATLLSNYYYRIRVEGRNKSLRRKFYRLVRIEKLRLLESGVPMSQINCVCKYLVSLKQINAERMTIELESDSKQLSFDFNT
jgi:hypothetical protein